MLGRAFDDIHRGTGGHADPFGPGASCRKICQPATVCFDIFSEVFAYGKLSPAERTDDDYARRYSWYGHVAELEFRCTKVSELHDLCLTLPLVPIACRRFDLSLLQLILFNSAMTVCVTVSEVSFWRILDQFITFMFLPACIIIVQYSYQKITGLGDPISMDRLVPKSLLMPGYFYEAHYPWNSPFMRPNGFFFVEPATASSYTASAAIMEIAYFRRPYRVILMIIATALIPGLQVWLCSRLPRLFCSPVRHRVSS